MFTTTKLIGMAALALVLTQSAHAADTGFTVTQTRNLGPVQATGQLSGGSVGGQSYTRIGAGVNVPVNSNVGFGASISTGTGGTQAGATLSVGNPNAGAGNFSGSFNVGPR